MDPRRSYSSKFLKAIQFVLPHEQVFARGHWGDDNFVIAENVPGDSGGWTKWGIDASSHPGVDIRNLTREGAIEIYWNEWQQYKIDNLPERIAIAQFDVRVNGGYASKWLQLAINMIASQNVAVRFDGHAVTPLKVDGALGPKTFTAANALTFPQENAILRYFIKQRDDRFEFLARKYPQDRQFLDGWKQRDRDLEKFLALK